MTRNLRFQTDRSLWLLPATTALAIAALTITEASAQPSPGETVYRCGPDGRSYSSTPCAAGKAVDVADPRSDEQRQQSRDAAQRERQLADRMTAERVKREKSTIPVAAGNLGPSAKPAAPAAKPAKSTKPKKKKKGKSTDPTMSDPIQTVKPKK